MDQVIIAVWLNENVTRDRNPDVPIAPEEIAADSAECLEAIAPVAETRVRFGRTLT